jgi:hypothetical protein
MSQAPGFSAVIVPRTDAVVAVFRRAAGAGGVDARAAGYSIAAPPASRHARGAKQTTALVERVSTDSGSAAKSMLRRRSAVREHVPLAEPTS